MPRQESLIVVGTCNIDVVCLVPSLPEPGRTIIASGIRREFGGKGANQAVAAARQGARTTLVCAVGADPDGERYIEHLRTENIRTDHVASLPGEATGCAHVYVDPAGENSIVVDRGANGRLGAAWVRAALADFQDAPAVLMTQLETPPEAVMEALKIAEAGGLRVVLNASPVDRSFAWGRHAIDTVVVNEHECAAWFGLDPARLRESPAPEAARLLGETRVRHLVVTRGGRPTLHFSADGSCDAIPAWPATPVDTVGAGDTFAGTLAAALCEKTGDWAAMIRRANIAAALSTLRVGAQAAMPTRSAVDLLLRDEAETPRADPV